MRGLGFVMIGIAGLGGCRNACQQVCVHMADYAEECGQSVSDAEIDACIERQSQDLEKDDLNACQDFGDLEVIRTQWACEDLADYWGDGGSQ
ncbi:MAG: hypothetical protein ABMB14_01025 [Myxococcota bacterium]